MDQADAALFDLYRQSQALALAWRRAAAAHEATDIDSLARARMAAEALRVTSRLMAVVCNLLQRRAIATGELPGAQLRPLDPAATLAGPVPEQFPDALRPLAEASRELYARVAGLAPA